MPVDQKKPPIDYYFDGYGCIVQKSDTRFNPVDSAFYTCNWFIHAYLCGRKDIKKFTKRYDNCKKRFSLSSGIQRRYWDPKYEFSNPNNLSRDNHIGFICYAALMGDSFEMKRIAKNMLRRWSLFQNTHHTDGKKKPWWDRDLCGPSQWTIILRGIFQGLGLVLIYPLLLILDIFFLLSIIADIIHSHYDTNYNGSLFHQVSQVEVVCRIAPTPFAYLSRFLLYNFRSRCHLDSNGNPTNKYDHPEVIITHIKEHCEAVYSPPVYEVTIKLLEDYRKRSLLKKPVF